MTFLRRQLERVLFHPRRDVGAPPAGAEDFFVEVDGARLHTRLHAPVAAERATVLFFHGNGGVVADYDDIARGYAQVGARFCVVDYRGYGASTGKPSLDDLLDDAPIAFAAVAARAASPLVVVGQSLGSACANELYAADTSAKGFILESGFASLRGVIERHGLRVDFVLARLGLERTDAKPKLARGEAPLLVLHGGDDGLIDVDEAHLAFTAAGGALKSIAIFDGFGHNDVAQAPGYFPAIAAFLDEITSRGRP
jgi:alpha-beta hydrolase superfamily lysophospholipase